MNEKKHVSWSKLRPERFDGIHVLYNLSREIQSGVGSDAPGWGCPVKLMMKRSLGWFTPPIFGLQVKWNPIKRGRVVLVTIGFKIGVAVATPIISE
jgi:hypothetical protein